MWFGALETANNFLSSTANRIFLACFVLKWESQPSDASSLIFHTFLQLFIHFLFFSMFKKTGDILTTRLMDRPMDQRTRPLIEMRGAFYHSDILDKLGGSKWCCSDCYNDFIAFLVSFQFSFLNGKSYKAPIGLVWKTSMSSFHTS